MIRSARLALAGAALLAGCGRMAPAARPEVPGMPFAASFSARISSPEGRVRLRGILASAGEGRLRVEIAGGGRSFLLVCRGEDLTALLGPEALFLREGSSSALLASITGMRLSAADLSALLAGAERPLPSGCDSRRYGARPLGETGLLPRKIRVTCPEGRLDLELDDASALDSDRVQRAFQPLEPSPRSREVGAEEFAGALREALHRPGR